MSSPLPLSLASSRSPPLRPSSLLPPPLVLPLLLPLPLPLVPLLVWSLPLPLVLMLLLPLVLPLVLPLMLPLVSPPLLSLALSLLSPQLLALPPTPPPCQKGQEYRNVSRSKSSYTHGRTTQALSGGVDTPPDPGFGI